MEWQPIETAPDGDIVVVGWLDDDDHETPERHDFDYKEDGVWVKHEDLYQEFCAVAPPGSRGPREQAPYTHWMAVPPLPEAPNALAKGPASAGPALAPGYALCLRCR